MRFEYVPVARVGRVWCAGRRVKLSASDIFLCYFYRETEVVQDSCVCSRMCTKYVVRQNGLYVRRVCGYQILRLSPAMNPTS